MSLPLRLQLLLGALIALCRGDEIDNGVVGIPVIDCQDGHVDFRVKTKKAFVGRIYAEGFQGASGCGITAFAPRGLEVSLRLNTNDCGMQKQRMTEPIQGMAFTVSLIVSFHGVFITKVDRAYALQCYFEQEKALVTSGILVSALPITEITGVDKRRECHYTVHTESENGPVANYAAVGDALYHKWECNDKSKGIRIHSCSGSDGRGHDFDFYDERGCTIDAIIMPEVVYSEDRRTAYVQSHAFKFSDRQTLNLECLVSMCDGTCAGVSPPNCGTRRVRRSPTAFPDVLPAGTFDAITKVRVLDLFDDQGRIASTQDAIPAGLPSPTGTCLARPGFVALLGAVGLLGLAAMATTTLLLASRHREPQLVI